MARWNGVRVLNLSLGFGPRCSSVRGGAGSCISAIPLGGYVKMAGETPDNPRRGRTDEFLSKGKWQRFQVLIVGPVMNMLLALVLMAVGPLQRRAGSGLSSSRLSSGPCSPVRPAERAGIQAGRSDRQHRGARRGDLGDRLFMQVMPRANTQVEVGGRAGRRAGRRLTVTPDAQTRFEMGDIGVLPRMVPQIRNVNPGSAAERAGLRVGDTILAVNGEPATRDSLIKKINASAGRGPRTDRPSRRPRAARSPSRRRSKAMSG